MPDAGAFGVDPSEACSSTNLRLRSASSLLQATRDVRATRGQGRERGSLSARKTDRLAPEDDFALGCTNVVVSVLYMGKQLKLSKDEEEGACPRVAINGAPCRHVCVACLGRVLAGSRALHRVVVARRSYLLMHGGSPLSSVPPQRLNPKELLWRPESRRCFGGRQHLYKPYSVALCKRCLVSGF